MEIIKGIGALLAVVAFGVGAVVVLGVAVAVVTLLAATAKFWVPALLVLLALAAVIAIVCVVANGQKG